MNEILINNLKYIFMSISLLSISYISNMLFSMYYNIKITNMTFDKNKLINGIVKMLIICLGTALLTCSVTLMPIFAKEVGITMEDEFINAFSTISIVGIFITSITKYTKESYDTLKNILNSTNESSGDYKNE